MSLKRGLQICDDWPFEPQMSVAPMMFVLRVAAPFILKRCAASEADSPVDDEHAAVRTAIRPINPPRCDRMIVGELTAGVRHHPDIRVVERPAGADTVKQDPHFDAGARTFD